MAESAPSGSNATPTISYQIVAALVEAIGGHPDVIDEGLKRFNLDELDAANGLRAQ